MIDTKQILVCAAVLVVAGTSLGIRAEEVCENPQQNVQVCTQFAGNSGNCKTSSLEPCDTSETDASAALYCPQVCNDRPVMTNPTVLLAEDTIITEASSVSLLEAVADANAGDTFELTNVGGTTTDGGGDIEFFSDGHYSYDPPLNFSGTDSVEITITDVQVPSVPLAVTGRLTFIISAVNDAPVAMNDVASTNQDTQLMSVASLVGNDTDVDSAGLTAVVETNKTTSRGGQIDIRSDGTFTYDPPTGFAGSDTVSYTVQDADAAFSSALLTIQVLAVTTGNNAPVAVSDLFALAEDAGVTKSSISLLANDADADGNVLTALTESAKATSESGLINIAADGSFTYDPPANFNGTDTVTYTVTDGIDSAVGALTITVSAVNDPPIANNDSAATGLNTLLTAALSLLSNDTDVDSDTLSLVSSDDPVTYPFDLPTANGGTVTVTASDGSYRYVPPNDFTGVDAVTYTVSDGSATDSGTLSVTVGAVSADYLEVQTLFDLSDEPLEVVTPSAPNVVVLIDSSKSMNADVMTTDADGYYSSGAYSGIFTKVSGEGAQAPKESATPGAGFWRLRTKDFNQLYYNPEVLYQAWAGCDPVVLGVSNCAASTTPAADSRYYYVWQDVADPSGCASNVVGTVDGTSPSTAADGTCTEGYLVSIKADGGSATAPGVLSSLRSFTKGMAADFRDGNSLYPKFPDRTDCSAVDACSLAEETANFDRWYRWSRDRGLAFKASLGEVLLNAEPSLRVGFANTNSSSGNYQIEALNAASGSFEHRTDLMTGIYGFSFNGLSQFYKGSDEAYGYLACNGASRFKGAANVCPLLGPPQGTCQQNYMLIVTDGVPEGASNRSSLVKNLSEADNDGIGVFDGAMFAGCSAAGCSHTLADIAMFYYESDINAGMTNDVTATQRDVDFAPANSFSDGKMHQHIKTYAIAFGVENTGLEDVPTVYETGAYDWGSDPADDFFPLKDLQHATVNGRGGFLGAQDPQVLASALKSAFDEFSTGIGAGSAVSFNSQEISNGVVLFRSFYNLVDSTGDIVASTLNADLTVGSELWSTAAQLDAQLASSAGRQILTFDPTVGDYEGIPFQFASLTGAQKGSLGWVDSSSDTIVTDKVAYLRGRAVNEQPAGPFRARPTEAGRLGDIVNSSPVYVGPPDQLFRGSGNYPTGSKSYSSFQAAQSTREERLYVAANDGMLHGVDPDTGDEVFAFIPNAALVNDSNVNLSELVSPSYGHQYVVDASPIADDVFVHPRGVAIASDGSAKQWRTMLIGAYGAGGKGLFSLDITDPNITESNASNKVFWEFTDQDDTYPHDNGAPLLSLSSQRLDASLNPIKDLGLTIDEPVLAMSNVVTSASDASLEWVALLSNGVNSTAGIAKLFAIFVDRGADGVWCHPDSGYLDPMYRGCTVNDYDFVKMDTGEGAYSVGGSVYPNGLGAARAIDADQDGTVDYVYAGDMKGNLYRFDLCRADLPAFSDWASSGLGPLPVTYSGILGGCKKGVEVYKQWVSTKIFTASFTASDGTTSAQPILNRPLVVQAENQRGYIVIIGTGRYFVNGDRADTDVQSMYGIWDRLGDDLVLKSKLVQQAYTNQCEAVTGDGGVTTTTCGRTLSDDSVDLYVSDDESVTPSVLGWFNDLNVAAGGDIAASSGERAVRNFQIRGGLGFVNSVLPTTSTACSASSGGFGLAFCPLTGGSSCLQDGVFDLNNDGSFDASDLINGAIVAGTVFEGSAPTDAAFVGENRVTQLSDRSLSIVRTNTETSINTGRLSWRRLSND